MTETMDQSLSSIMLEERRSIGLLKDEPADDCCLGAASGLCEFYDAPCMPVQPVMQCREGGPVTSALGDTLESDSDRSTPSELDPGICCDKEPGCHEQSDREDYQLIDLQYLSQYPRDIWFYDAPCMPVQPVMQCREGGPVTSALGDTLESDSDRSTPSELDPGVCCDKEPGCHEQSDREDYQLIDLQYLSQYPRDIWVFDVPCRPVPPVMQCWAGGLVTSALGDTLESDSDRSTPSELDPGFCCDKEPGCHKREMTPVFRFDEEPGCHEREMTPVFRFNPLLDFDNDCVDMGAPAFSRSDSDVILTSLDMDHNCVAHGTCVERNTPVLVHQQTGSGDSSWGESVALGEQACLGIAAGSSVRPPEALLEAGSRAGARSELECSMSDMLDMHLEMRQRLDAVEHTLTFGPQQQESLREEEQRVENHLQPQRKQTWFKRLGNTLKRLGKRKRKRKEECEGGEGGPGCDELCPITQDVSISQATMGKMCEADACVRNRRAASRDQQRMDLLQEQLEDLERRFQKQKVQLQNAESALERRQIEAANLPSTSNKNLRSMRKPRSVHPQRPLLPSANWVFNPRNNDTACGRAEALKEEKRRKEEILKSKKPKKMGLKRRFFLCLRCLT